MNEEISRLKNKIFKEVAQLVIDLIHDGENIRADILGNSIQGVYDGHSVKFSWEFTTWLLPSGKFDTRIRYYLLIDDIYYAYNHTLVRDQRLELKILYYIRKQMEKIAMTPEDRSEIKKWMNKRKKLNT